MRLRSIFVVFILLLIASGALAQRRVMEISSYIDDGSPYPTFGAELAVYLNERFGADYEFINLPSQGSIDNLLNLKEDAEFAIVQEDVAHYYYSGARNPFFSSAHSDDRNIASLTRLFQEEVYLLVRPGIESPRDIETFFIGERRSGSYATYTNYIKYHHPHWREVSDGDSRRMLRDGEIDAIFEVSSTPYRDILDFSETTPCGLLPVERHEVSMDLDLYESTTIPDSLAPGGIAAETVSVPALLLVKRDLPTEIAEAVIEAIFDKPTRRRVFSGTWPYLEALEFRTDDGTPDINDEHIKEMPLPPHPAVVVSTLGRFPYIDFAMLAVGLVVMGIFLLLIPKRTRYFGYLFRSSPIRRLVHQAALVVIAALTWAVIACWGIKYLEIQGLSSGATLIDNAFVNMGVVDLLRWATIFSFTGYEDTGFPLMGFGKMLAVSIHLVGLGMITWLGAQVISHLVARIMSRRQEMDLTNKKGHVVICNWNDQGPRLIEELHDEHVPKERLKRDIVVLSADPTPPVPTEARDGVYHVDMEPWNLGAYDKTGLKRADSVIILTPAMEGADEDADGIVLRIALAIRRYFGDLDGDFVPPKILAQLRGSPKAHVIQEMGIDDFVYSRNLGARILAQAVISPGITEFFTEILTNGDDSNEVYSCGMPKELCKGKADFWRVMEYFLDRPAGDNPSLPIGLRIRKRKAGEKGFKTLLNPTIEQLRQHSVGEFRMDDKVVVFADNQPLEPVYGYNGGL